MKPVLSFDIEEWFHLMDLPCQKPIERWDEYELRAELILPKILNLLKENNSKATFFILGWLAERKPKMIENIIEDGHEIASHGYAHEMIHRLSPKEFEEDIQKSKRILENITGKTTKGYRAPAFTITEKTPWAFDILLDNGFEYDSSIFPGPRLYGHMNGAPKNPYSIKCNNGSIFEFPQSVMNFGLFKFSFFGGGYFRLAPNFLIQLFSKYLLSKNGYVTYYLHPKDFDVNQPKFDFGRLRHLQTYINISKSEKKLSSILNNFESRTYEEILFEMQTERNTQEFPVTMEPAFNSL